MGATAQYLKSSQSGRVFQRTEELASRSDMVPCTPQGELLTGHTAEAEAAVGVRLSKYLGFPDPSTGKPGRLLFYSEQLATKAGAVSIDKAEDWPGDISNVVSSVAAVKPTAGKAEPASSPALSRTSATPESNQAEIDAMMAEASESIDLTDGLEAEPVVTTEGLTVPDVTKITDKKEAQAALCKWAFDNFGKQLNRTWGVERMTNECRLLIDAPAEVVES